MADIFDSHKRSELMSSVRSRDTWPELRVRHLLHAMGYRFRLHAADLPGKPDIVLPRYRTVIFVNGCFWHGHRNCGAAKRPKTNTNFWNEKIDGTIARDKRKACQLRRSGWKVIVAWECEVSHWEAIPAELVRTIVRPCHP